MTRRLLILPNNPGDVVMGLHAATALKNSFPHDALAFVVDQECASLVDGNPCVDLCIKVPRKSIREALDPTQALAWVDHLIESCNAFAPDLVINLFQGDYAAILATMIVAKEYRGKIYDHHLHRIVVRDVWSRYLHAIPANRHANNLHVVDIFLRICDVPASYPIRASLPAVAVEELVRLPVIQSQRPLIAIQAGSAWIGKQWPASHWQELARWFCQETDYTIVLLGAPQEQDLCANIAHGLPNDRIINACGTTSLLSTRVLLARCECLFCGDTFAMHAASALGIPVIALFGPSNPIETGPYQPGARILCARDPASIGEQLDLRDGSWLQALPVSAVIATWQGSYAKEGKDGPVLMQSFWNGSHIALYNKNKCQQTHLLPENADLTFFASLAQPHLLLLQSALDLWLDTPSPHIAQSIEAHEQELARCTYNSISFEMYRMELNGLAAPDPRTFVIERRHLVQKMLSLCMANLSPNT